MNLWVKHFHKTYSTDQIKEINKPANYSVLWMSNILYVCKHMDIKLLHMLGHVCLSCPVKCYVQMLFLSYESCCLLLLFLIKLFHDLIPFSFLEHYVHIFSAVQLPSYLPLCSVVVIRVVCVPSWVNSPCYSTLLYPSKLHCQWNISCPLSTHHHNQFRSSRTFTELLFSEFPGDWVPLSCLLCFSPSLVALLRSASSV